MTSRKVFFTPVTIIALTGALAVTLTLSTSRSAAPLSREEQERELEQKHQVAKATLTVLNRDKTCVGDGECEVLEMGHKACGGPSEFVIYSTTGRNAVVVKNKVLEITKLEKEIALQSAFAKDCASPTAPEARCVKGQCSPK